MAERPNYRELEQANRGLADELSACQVHLTRLIDREKMYREFIEKTDELVLRVDSQGCFTFANHAAEKIIGLKPDRLIGRLAFDFVHPDDRQNTQTAFNGWISDRMTSLTFENRLVNQASQQAHFMLWTITLSYDRHGHFTGVNSIARDVTQRKKSELERQQLTHQLEERIKELNCLYEISRMREKPAFSLDEIIQRVVELIPSSMQFPDISCAQVAFDGYAYQTDNYRSTDCKLLREVMVNNEPVCTLQVCYLEERPGSSDTPFMEEEHHLITAIAEQLGNLIEREWAEIELRKHREHLEELLNTRTQELARSTELLNSEIRRRRAAELALAAEESDA